jgi:hypothetical protein
MDPLRDGVQNLVQECAEVKDRDEVLILNEFGKVDEEIAKLIAETVKATGAAYHVMWGEGVERSAKALPKILIGAILSSAKIISNFSLNRALLDEYTRGKGIVQINNVARTVNLMASNHARYHWGMVRAIYSRLEEIFSAARKWQITSPAGTEIGGEISSGSEVADAYFAEEAEASRFIRVFPGEVYTPVGSKGADGKIVVEYINMRDSQPWEETVTLTIRANKVIKIEGGSRAQQFEKTMEANVKAHGDKATLLDSWHGGMNPKARKPTAENMSLQGATSGPALMHFHLGSQKEPISAGILYHSIELDGRKVYDGGKLLALEDAKIKEAERQYGLAS